MIAIAVFGNAASDIAFDGAAPEQVVSRAGKGNSSDAPGSDALNY
jgi:hypothetical protein